jgi:hypothetical protein
LAALKAALVKAGLVRAALVPEREAEVAGAAHR